ncbi:MAG: hypothetical protein R3F53_00650 [Gammaproteobacteria bacterium]
MATFEGFKPDRQLILVTDVRNAINLSTRCANSVSLANRHADSQQLHFQPHLQAYTVSQLLSDTFGINGHEHQQTTVIRDKFLNVAARLKRAEFIFSAKPPGDPGHLKLGAYTEAGHRTANTIFITAEYFGSKTPPAAAPPLSKASTVTVATPHTTPTDRAAILIHEGIHLLHPEVQQNAGHPGPPGLATPLLFDRAPMRIPYSSAVLNPYCYQNFALWLK